MAESLLRLEAISSEDKDLVGRKLADLGQLSRLGLNVRSGFVLTFVALEEPMELAFSKVRNLLPNHLNKIPTETYQFIFEQSKNWFSLKPDLQKFLENHLRKEKKPFLITAYFEDKNGQTFSFSQNSESFNDFGAALASLWIALLNKPFLEKYSLKEMQELKMSVFISSHQNPHVSAVASSSRDLGYEVKAQWGEFNPSEALDKITRKKNSDQIIYETGLQKKQIVFLNGTYKVLDVAAKFQKTKKLSDNELSKIFLAIERIDRNFLLDYEIRVSFTNGKLLINDISFNTLSSSEKEKEISLGINLPLAFKIAPVFPGVTSGFVTSLVEKKEKKLHKGEIALVKEINKHNLSFLKNSSGIIVENKPQLHYIRSLSLPIAAGKTENLNNKVVTLDGKTGKIFWGAFTPYTQIMENPYSEKAEEKALKTATKVYLTLNHPKLISEVENSLFDGIGPVNGENLLGHLKTSREDQVQEYLVEVLEKIAKKASGKPIIYQVDSSEESLEPHLLAVKKLRNKLLFKNINLSLTKVGSNQELEKIHKIISRVGLHRSPSFKIFLSLDLPANIFQLKSFKETGLDGCLINYSSLSSLTLGKEVSFQDLVSLKEPSVEEIIKTTLVEAKKNSLPVFLYGFPLESKNHFLTTWLKSGLKGICSPQDSLALFRKNLSFLEEEMVRN